MNNLEQAIREYLPNIIHMSLGTCADGKPWVCQVHFAYDNELNLYFCSSTATRHCQEIAQNSHVSGSISVQHGPADKPSCIDFEGTAEAVAEITDNDLGYLAYEDRFPGRLSLVDYLKPENGGRMYKITVSDFYVFDVSGKLDTPGKHHVAWQTSRPMS